MLQQRLTFPLAFLLNTGAKDQCVMDALLWDPQWFCTGVQLDLGAEGPGGLWHWRSASVVSKYSRTQISFPSLFYVFKNACIKLKTFLSFTVPSSFFF